MDEPLRPDIVCPECGYDLRGTPVPRCPECGFHYQREALRSIARQRTSGQAARLEFAAVGQAITCGPLLLAMLFAGRHMPITALIVLWTASACLAALLRWFLATVPPGDAADRMYHLCGPAARWSCVLVMTALGAKFLAPSPTVMAAALAFLALMLGVFAWPAGRRNTWSIDDPADARTRAELLRWRRRNSFMIVVSAATLAAAFVYV